MFIFTFFFLACDPVGTIIIIIVIILDNKR